MGMQVSLKSSCLILSALLVGCCGMFSGQNFSAYGNEKVTAELTRMGIDVESGARPTGRQILAAKTAIKEQAEGLKASENRALQASTDCEGVLKMQNLLSGGSAGPRDPIAWYCRALRRKAEIAALLKTAEEAVAAAENAAPDVQAAAQALLAEAHAAVAAAQPTEPEEF